MNKYIEAEKRLAELLGWTDVEYNTGYFEALCGMPPHVSDISMVKIESQWCRDWNACGPLMVEHDLELRWSVEKHAMVTGHWLLPKYITVPVADHPDKDTAVRYAIVMAVIAKLSE